MSSQMDPSFRPNREIVPLPASVLYAAGALVGWVMLVFIYRVDSCVAVIVDGH